MPASVQRIEHSKELLDLSPVGSIIHDEFHIFYANKFITSLLGYEEQAELIKVPILNLVHPAFRPAIAERIRRIQSESEITPPKEIQMLQKDGTAIDVETSGFPVLFGGQKASQVIIQDISRRKSAEREATRQRLDLQHTLNTVQGIVWRADARTFQFQFVSQQAEKILGYPVSAWLEAPDFWVNHIHPEDRQWTVDFCVAQTKALQHHEFEYRMIAADGRAVWLRDVVSVELANGEAKTLYGLMTDITVNKKLEQGLHESEARYRIMAENSKDIIVKFKPEGAITYVSPAVKKILGFGVAQVLAMNVFDLVHPDDLSALKTQFAAYKTNHENRTVTYRCRDYRDHYIWLEAIISAICLSNGEVDEFLVTCREITDRKQIEAKLQKSHDLLNKISMQVPGIIFQLRRDVSGHYSFPYLSQTVRVLGELDPENSDTNFDVILSRLHPEDRDLFLTSMEKSAADLTKFSLEYRIIFPKMGFRWRLAESQPERFPDGTILWHGHISDITERKLMQDALFESEAKARTIAEHSPIGIFMVNDRGENIFSNKWLHDKLGSQPDEMVNFEWMRFVHPDDVERVQQSWEEFWKQDWPYSLEYRAVSKSGNIFCFQVKAQKLFKLGVFIGAVGVVEDVTEKKFFEQQIRELSGKIIDLTERERAEFSRELHDTVGQNLVLLKLSVQHKMQQLGEEQQGVLKDMIEPINEALRTIRDIARKLSPLHLRTLGLALAIEDLCDQIKKIRPYEIELSLKGLDDATALDANIQLYRIVQEAITNILKHSNATKISIVYEKRSEGSQVRISDNGGGSGERGVIKDGIGLQIMRERARSIGAGFNFLKNQYGAEVSIEFYAKSV